MKIRAVRACCISLSVFWVLGCFLHSALLTTFCLFIKVLRPSLHSLSERLIVPPPFDTVHLPKQQKKVKFEISLRSNSRWCTRYSSSNIAIANANANALGFLPYVAPPASYRIVSVTNNSAGAVPNEGAHQSGSGSGVDGGGGGVGGAAAASAALLEQEREATRDQTAASVEEHLQVL